MFNNIKTKADLALEKSNADYLQATTALKVERDLAFSKITHTFSSGSIVQARPGDLASFQLAISLGKSEDWAMDDANAVAVELLTVADMQEALDDGIAQGKVIWGNYTSQLKAL
jgi:hypothetical protein